MRALRDGQDVDSLPGHTHADQDTQDKALEVGETVDRVTDHNQNSESPFDPEEGW